MVLSVLFLMRTLFLLMRAAEEAGHARKHRKYWSVGGNRGTS